jgi:hypothetical protein
MEIGLIHTRGLGNMVIGNYIASQDPSSKVTVNFSAIVTDKPNWELPVTHWELTIKSEMRVTA